ncbi:MAG: glycosyltransferase family 4 protein [Bacteroidales bacterium]|jgi:glycosyltransferase involved in cell wall biosynthesis|nr:glycosyltransferase family 4 protein [Bacteroidales bacterium]
MNNKKNIGFFTVGSLNYSGAALQAFKVASGLERYNVIFFSKDPSASKILSKSIFFRGHQVVILPQLLPCRFIIIAYFILKFRIRVCHFHGFSIRNMAPCLLLGCRLILKTTLLDEDDFETQLGSKKKYLLRFMLSKISYNVVLTKHLQEINQRYISPEKVKVIHNGIIAQKLPDTKTDNIFCYAGLVCPRKRTYNTIQYFADNYAYLPGAILYIIGPDSTSYNLSEFSQDYYDSCIDLINRNHIQSQVIFTGNIPFEEVLDIYRKAKVFIFLSLKEGLPNSVLEAMSFNCVPIISPMDGAAEEMIEDGVEGFILEDEKRVIPIEAINSILQSEKAYHKVNSCFSIQNTVAQLSELYDNLIKK